MEIDPTAVFNAVIVALLVALVASLAWNYGHRAATLRGQESALADWSRTHGYIVTTGPDQAMPLVAARSGALTGLDRRLFDGIAAGPPVNGPGQVHRLLHRREAAVRWVVQHRLRHRHPARPEPRSSLGQAFGYLWGNFVATDVSPAAGPLLVTPRRRMRTSLWLHRRLRTPTGDPAFDREFGVLGPEGAQSILSPAVRAWLLERGIQPKTVLVVDGGLCYAARHEPLRVSTLADRIALVRDFSERAGLCH